MNILVCISHVPETTTKIQFDPTGAALVRSGVTFVIGPFDEYALSRALEFKEKLGGGKVIALCVGGADVEPTIRKALAIGADEGVRIDTPAARDPYTIAKQIASYAEGKGFDLIMMGKESIEHNDGAVPAMVAEMLGLPFVPYVKGMEAAGGKAHVHREVDGGSEAIEVTLPAVISATKGIAEWRIPNMRGIMASRTKPLAVVAAVPVEAMLTTAKYDLPPAKQGVKMIAPDHLDELVQVLATKGVI
jgi:electron transfer flavoprotein beta subunit